MYGMSFKTSICIPYQKRIMELSDVPILMLTVKGSEVEAHEGTFLGFLKKYIILHKIFTILCKI